MRFEAPTFTPIDPSLKERLEARIAGKAKPPGSLGRLEALAVQIGLIQNTLAPNILAVEALIFAGDHGLTEEGVSAYPSAVTAAMVATFLNEAASVNALARACGVGVTVVDAGVDADLPPHDRLLDAKVRRGSRNAAREPALLRDEVDLALRRGAEIAANRSADALAIGEMGIGNTASAALLMHCLAPAPLEDCIGLGAGHDYEGFERKKTALRLAAARATPKTAIEALCDFGGLEIAMMAGAFLGGAGAGKVMIVDGFISSVAALAAIRMSEGLEPRLVFAHVSAERGHERLLEALEAKPLLQLGMRLGEASGAVLLAPMLKSAARLMSETASLENVLAGRFSP